MMLLQLLIAEREAQDAKWGSQRHLSPGTWLAILTEEVGEVAQATLGEIDQDGAEQLARELTQVAAVALAWMESMLTVGMKP